MEHHLTGTKNGATSAEALREGGRKDHLGAYSWTKVSLPPDHLLFFHVDGLYYVAGEDLNTLETELGLEIQATALGLPKHLAQSYAAELARRGIQLAVSGPLAEFDSVVARRRTVTTARVHHHTNPAVRACTIRIVPLERTERVTLPVFGERR